MAVEPVNESASLVSASEVHQQFELLLRDRAHMGLRNLLSDIAMEPRNPFQQVQRRPRKWLVAFGGLALLAALIVYYFHLR